jgi:hypothetical protein
MVSLRFCQPKNQDEGDETPKNHDLSLRIR